MSSRGYFSWQLEMLQLAGAEDAQRVQSCTKLQLTVADTLLARDNMAAAVR